VYSKPFHEGEAIAVVVAFLVGFLPQCSKTRRLEGELHALQQANANAELRDLAGLSYVQATALCRFSKPRAPCPELFVLLDDSTRSSSLGTQLPELKLFLKSLPLTTQVAVGYIPLRWVVARWADANPGGDIIQMAGTRHGITRRKVHRRTAEGHAPASELCCGRTLDSASAPRPLSECTTAICAVVICPLVIYSRN
jgi:hypothetical protein